MRRLQTNYVTGLQQQSTRSTKKVKSGLAWGEEWRIVVKPLRKNTLLRRFWKKYIVGTHPTKLSLYLDTFVFFPYYTGLPPRKSYSYTGRGSTCFMPFLLTFLSEEGNRYFGCKVTRLIFGFFKGCGRCSIWKRRSSWSQLSETVPTPLIPNAVSQEVE